jgi:molybdopterin synthase sulfur carrier subunit
MAETPVMRGIRVRYWAAARSAAGVGEDFLDADEPLSLTQVRARAVELHPDGRLEKVLTACSALVADRPAGSSDPDQVLVTPGETVEFLPPFAGG